MHKSIKLTLISGTLGAGKTTLIKQLLKQKPKDEHWVLLVNEFGAIGIDGAILNEQAVADIVEIPGGCICCSSQAELTETLLNIAQNSAADRVIIEPTGLGEPDKIIDIFNDINLEKYYQIQSLISVFDASHTSLEELHSLKIMQSLVTMADIIIINKTDLAKSSQLEALEHYFHKLYPPKQNIIFTQNSLTPNLNLNEPHFSQHKTAELSFNFLSSENGFKLNKTIEAPEPIQFKAKSLPHLLKCNIQQDLHKLAIGWVFDEQAEFNWQPIQALLNQFKNQKQVLRAKAILKVGENARMLFQYVNQQTSRDIIAYRKDSRFEVIFESASSEDLNALEKALEQALKA